MAIQNPRLKTWSVWIAAVVTVNLLDQFRVTNVNLPFCAPLLTKYLPVSLMLARLSQICNNSNIIITVIIGIITFYYGKISGVQKLRRIDL